MKKTILVVLAIASMFASVAYGYMDRFRFKVIDNYKYLPITTDLNMHPFSSKISATAFVKIDTNTIAFRLYYTSIQSNVNCETVHVTIKLDGNNKDVDSFQVTPPEAVTVENDSVWYPSVIYAGNMYHMWYTRNGAPCLMDPEEEYVYYAVSTDGYSFSNGTRVIVEGDYTEFHGFTFCDDSVDCDQNPDALAWWPGFAAVGYNETKKEFYCLHGSNAPNHPLGAATSKDGITWTHIGYGDSIAGPNGEWMMQAGAFVADLCSGEKGFIGSFESRLYDCQPDIYKGGSGLGMAVSKGEFGGSWRWVSDPNSYSSDIEVALIGGLTTNGLSNSSCRKDSAGMSGVVLPLLPFVGGKGFWLLYSAEWGTSSCNYGYEGRSLGLAKVYTTQIGGDVNFDGKVDFWDLSGFAVAFGKSAGEEGYEEAFDFDRNGVIDFMDVSGFSSRYGEECSYGDYDPIIDLDVDTDRDGYVSRDVDEDGEDSFTSGRGAVILVNSDRDQDLPPTPTPTPFWGALACPDHSDYTTNTTTDREDMSEIVIRSWGLAPLPTQTSRIVLRMKDFFPTTSPSPSSTWVPMGDKVRVFDENGNVFLGDGMGTRTPNMRGSEDGYFFQNVTEDIRTNKDEVVCYAEALRYPYHVNDNDEFDGNIELELQLQYQTAGATWVDDPQYKDTVRLKVAPRVFAWNGQDADVIYATDWIDDDLRAIFPNVTVTGSPDHHIWLQDYVEFANCSLGNGSQSAMPVLMHLHHTRGDPFYEWVNGRLAAEHELGYDPFYNIHGNGGSIECTPPYTGFPLGRILIGDPHPGVGFDQGIRYQNVQLGAIAGGLGDPLQLDTSWLHVGHVDEVLSFVPVSSSLGYVCLVASPETAVDILHECYVNSHPVAPTPTVNVPLYCGSGSWQQSDVQTELVKIDPTPTGRFATARLSSDINNATTLTFDISPQDTSNEIPFAHDDVVRIDNEYMRVDSHTGTTVVIRTGDRGYWGSTASAHAAGSIVYAVSERVEDNLEGGGHQAMIDGMITPLAGEMPGLSATIVNIPVLFDWYYPGRALAYTADVANCLVANGKVIMPDTGGPMVGTTNRFHEDIVSKMQAVGISPTHVHFIDGDTGASQPSWPSSTVTPTLTPVQGTAFLHAYMGSVHCASNARRVPISGTAWWDAWHTTPTPPTPTPTHTPTP